MVGDTGHAALLRLSVPTEEPVIGPARLGVQGGVAKRTRGIGPTWERLQWGAWKVGVPHRSAEADHGAVVPRWDRWRQLAVLGAAALW